MTEEVFSCGVDDDRNAMAELFCEVFGCDLSEAMHHWKYADGGGQGYALYDQERRMLAHCGMLPRFTHVGGTRQRVFQVIDLMVAKSTRGRHLSRHTSPFARVVGAAFARLQSQSGNSTGLAFGFPSDRAMRLGERLGYFIDMGRLFHIDLKPQPSGAATYAEMQMNSGGATLVDILWAGMASDFAEDLIGERNVAYWEWRYAGHPEYRYRLFSIKRRWRLRPCACIVLREMTDGRWLWVDYVGRRKDFSVAARAAMSIVADLQGQTLYLLGTEPVVDALVEIGLEANPTEIRILANAARGEDFSHRFMSRWWLMAGDTDYH